jgi:hypothetical protein
VWVPLFFFLTAKEKQRTTREIEEKKRKMERENDIFPIIFSFSSRHHRTTLNPVRVARDGRRRIGCLDETKARVASCR